jgi:hypothetical protein
MPKSEPPEPGSVCRHHEAIEESMHRIERKLDAIAELLGSYPVVRSLVFGAACLILTSALAALVALVIRQ